MSYMLLCCPLLGCEWSYREPLGADARFTQVAVDYHMESHELRDFLATISSMNALLHDAWGVIANAGLHRGNWDNEDPEWVEAAKLWRDRFHAQLKINTHDTEGGPDVG